MKTRFLTLSSIILLTMAGCTHLVRIEPAIPQNFPSEGKTTLNYEPVTTASESKFVGVVKMNGHTFNLESTKTQLDMVSNTFRQVMSERGFFLDPDAVTDENVKLDLRRFVVKNVPAMWSLSLQTDITVRIDYDFNGKTGNFEVSGYGKNVCQMASTENFELSITRALDDLAENLRIEFAANGL